MELEFLKAPEIIRIGLENFATGDILLTVFFIISIVLSALVTGAEAAVYSINLEILNKLREEEYERTEILFRDSRSLIFTARFAHILLNGIALVTSLFLYAEHIYPHTRPFIGLLVFFIVITGILVVFGEILPKIYAYRHPRTTALRTTSIMRMFKFIFSPFINIASKEANKNTELSLDQLTKVLEMTEDSELKEEKDILEGIVKFGNTYAADIIRPRINVIALNITDSFETVKQTIIEHGYSRLPVYKENLDNIVGILYIKDVISKLYTSPELPWQELIRPAYFVPETKKINDLLKEFQLKKVHLAIVVDEYAGTSGIVTMEDILEEIVGDINDEYDEAKDTYIRINENAFIFDASTSINDFIKIIDCEPERFKDIEGDADSLAGLILELKGELPKRGEIVTYKKFKFTVLEANNRRIEKIKYELIAD